jgi:hypothetical protein
MNFERLRLGFYIAAQQLNLQPLITVIKRCRLSCWPVMQLDAYAADTAAYYHIYTTIVFCDFSCLRILVF